MSKIKIGVDIYPVGVYYKGIERIGFKSFSVKQGIRGLKTANVSRTDLRLILTIEEIGGNHEAIYSNWHELRGVQQPG